MNELQGLLNQISTALEDGRDAHGPTVSACRLIMDSLSAHVGHDLALDEQTVRTGDLGLTAAGAQCLAAGTAPPFPLRLTARVSVDLAGDAPSAVVVLLLTTRNRDGTEVLLGPNNRSYVWHELDLAEGTWRVGGWAVDEYGEFQA